MPADRGTNCPQSGSIVANPLSLGACKMANDKVQGEGNYDAAREYNEKTAEFAKDHDKVEKAAQDAKKAVEDPEADALEEAEKEGEAPARH
jgi:hypothetical protein